MGDKTTYGDQFESMIILIMSGAIVLSLLGVVALTYSHARDCIPADYTYCEMKDMSHH